MIWRVEKTLTDRFGLLARPGWQSTLRDLIDEIGRRHRLSIEEAALRVVGCETLLREVADGLSVGESFFMRDRPQLERVASELVERARKGLPSAVWSAGCSRGEEPYSLTMLLSERLSALETSSVTIVANDMHRARIEQAREALYSTWSLRTIGDVERGRHFVARADGSFALQPHLRSTVRFEHRTIEEQLAFTSPASIDIVLFRNVGIYVTAARFGEVIRGIAATLRPGGRLVMAPTDPPLLGELDVALERQAPGIYLRVDRRLARKGDRDRIPSDPTRLGGQSTLSSLDDLRSADSRRGSLAPSGSMVSSGLHASAPHASALQASALQASALQASALQASALQASALQASALQASALQASALQASALQASALHDGRESMRSRSERTPSTRPTPLRPELAGSDIQFAMSLADRGSLDLAYERLEAIVEERPADRPARMARAQVLLALGRLRESENEFKWLEQTDRNDAVSRYFRVICLLALKLEERAITELERLERDLEALAEGAWVGEGSTRQELLAAIRSDLRGLR